MGAAIDLTGQRFGKWSVVCRDVGSRSGWLCRCDCGTTRTVVSNNLKNGSTTSCGCANRIDLTGRVFGRLTVRGLADKQHRKFRHWEVQCACGTVLVLETSTMTRDNRRSCGCILKEQLDLAGHRFGRWTALSIDSVKPRRWLCRCDCGTVRIVSAHTLKNGRSKSCGCMLRDQKRKAAADGVLKGRNCWNWKGGSSNQAGYRLLTLDPRDLDAISSAMVNNRNQVLEHRLVMAREMGRPISRKETVHHINGDRADNRIENLQLRQGDHGPGVALCCRRCGSSDIESVPIAEAAE